MNTETVCTEAMPPKRRLIDRIYPHHYCDCPEPDEIIRGAGDVINVEVEVRLDWKDRLRTLVSGRLFVQARVATEKPCGATKANSVCYPLAP